MACDDAAVVKKCWKFDSVVGLEEETAHVFTTWDDARARQMSRWSLVAQRATVPLAGSLLCALSLLYAHLGTLDVFDLVKQQRRWEGRMWHLVMSGHARSKRR